jgi:hypothetical protein
VRALWPAPGRLLRGIRRAHKQGDGGREAVEAPHALLRARARAGQARRVRGLPVYFPRHLGTPDVGTSSDLAPKAQPIPRTAASYSPTPHGSPAPKCGPRLCHEYWQARLNKPPASAVRRGDSARATTGGEPLRPVGVGTARSTALEPGRARARAALGRTASGHGSRDDTWPRGAFRSETRSREARSRQDHARWRKGRVGTVRGAALKPTRHRTSREKRARTEDASRRRPRTACAFAIRARALALK